MRPIPGTITDPAVTRALDEIVDIDPNLIAEAAERLQASESWVRSRLRVEVLAQIVAERERQDEKWGEQNHPDGTTVKYAVDSAWIRERTTAFAKAGILTWADVLEEEVVEALAEEDSVALRAELVQVAAVAVAWIEAIDRRS